MRVLAWSEENSSATNGGIIRGAASHCRSLKRLLHKPRSGHNFRVGFYKLAGQRPVSSDQTRRFEVCATASEGHRILRSCSSSRLVLVDQATQHVAPPDGCADSWPGNRIGPRIWRLQAEASMRPSGVVVRDVAPKHSLQVTAADHEDPVQTLGPDCANPPLRECVRSRGSDRGLDDLHALGAEHLVEGTGELGVPVADEEPEAAKALPHARFRACWVTHAESGLLVTPRTCTRRDANSIANSTYSVRSQAVSTVKKSNPRIPSARPDELAPCRTVTVGSGAESVRPKERAYLRGRDPHTELGELPLDPQAPPPDSLTAVGCQAPPRAALTARLAASTMSRGEGRLGTALRARETCPERTW